MHNNFLLDFKGYLQSDAFSGYNWALSDSNIISVGCHVHARRPFAELAKSNKNSGLSHEALKFYRKLFAVEKETRDNKSSVELRYILRQEKSVPILAALKKWLDYHLPKTSDSRM